MPAISKVTYGGRTLMDLTEDSVTPETLLVGATAHMADGTPIDGIFYPSMLLTFTEKTVAASAWASSSDQSGAGFGFRAAVALTGVTADMVPDVYFSAEDAVSGQLSPVAKTYAGGVYIYAASKPTAAITIPTIRLTKQGGGA